MENIMLDSSFLIDWQRESQQRKNFGARLFLESNSSAKLYVPVAAWGEFLIGFDEQSRVPEYIEQLVEIVPYTIRTCEKYAFVWKHLQSKGNLIGANDMWIAASALEHGFPCVTRNVGAFSRIPGLMVAGY